MIQFNLLPDVKQQYIRTLRTKRLVMGVSFIASGVALTVMLLLVLTVYVVQRKSISDLHNTINTTSNTLKNTPQLATILTVQSQLNSLASLNSQSPAASRLFGFLSQVIPTQTTISDIQIDFTQNTMTLTGNAPSLAAVNTLVDNLKYTTYTISGQTSSQDAFSSVVLSSFGFGNSSSSASYSITQNFDPIIFNNGNTVTLSVGGNPPATASQQPSIIFSKGT